MFSVRKWLFMPVVSRHTLEFLMDGMLKKTVGIRFIREVIAFV
jgi:hypothetical protein